MKTNTQSKSDRRTHEGAQAQAVSPFYELKRTVMACLLWENQFYESGESVADRIRNLVPRCKYSDVAVLTRQAKEDMKLRHTPLFLTVELFRHPQRDRFIADLVYDVVRRPDEMGELVSLYWERNGQRTPLPAQMKKGLARAFNKWDAYSFAKWDRKTDIQLRDVMFLVHPKPADDEHKKIFETLADRNAKLPVPNTWETRLSGGEDKKQVFQDLLKTGRMPGMACLMNLRNMSEAGVDTGLIKDRLERGIPRALPFRFITAAQQVPEFEPMLETSMLKSVEGKPKLGGHTCLLVDKSGSMTDILSTKSIMRRIDAACGLAILLREVCESISIATFSIKLVTVPARRGFALRDAVQNSQLARGTLLATSLEAAYRNQDVQRGRFRIEARGRFGEWKNADRLIVITDEQSHDGTYPGWAPHSYMLNVASFRNGVSYGNGWTHIDGWSESVVDYIHETENMLED